MKVKYIISYYMDGNDKGVVKIRDDFGTKFGDWRFKNKKDTLAKVEELKAMYTPNSVEFYKY